jgi:hypothetical protein
MTAHTHLKAPLRGRIANSDLLQEIDERETEAARPWRS